MDVGEDESGLIHSKFRKAQRKFVSRLPTECHPPPPIADTTQSQLPHHSHPTTITRCAAFEDDSMHVDFPPSTLTVTPNRLQTVITTGHSLPKSPIFGTNVFFPTNPIIPSVPLNSPVGGIVRASHPHMPSTSFTCEVFRFDSTDRERYLCSVSEEEEVFSPSPSYSSYDYDSPQIVLDSPRITFSPLRIQDSPPHSIALTPSPKMESQNRLLRGHPSLTMLPPTPASIERCLYGVPTSPISPLTPNTPLSPSPLFNVEQTFPQGFLAELYRRRCHSDSDLPLIPDTPKPEMDSPDLRLRSTVQSRLRKAMPHPLTIPCKGGSLESENSSPQDSPLDLSMKGSRERFSSSTSCESLTTTRYISSLASCHSPGVSAFRGDITSPSAKATRNSVALRYNLEVSAHSKSPLEQMPAGMDMAFVCPVCGQMFSLHDRLAKHMASRHKSKPTDPNKSYPCEICHRSFARSDMLTRHVRLHTGIKPYTCKTCGQVFSRSDHLSTHQRTHTGDKPYKCPQCPYAACRRDMITRHLRTHLRSADSRSSSSSFDQIGSVSTPSSMTSTTEFFPDIKMEQSRPPSSNSSFAPDSPLSPTLHISALSVNSPSPL